MRLVSRKRWPTLTAVAALATVGALGPLTPASADPGDDSGVVVATGWVTLLPFPTNGVSVAATANLCVNGVALDDAGVPHVYADGVANVPP
ncbi:MAG: hypothetical protein QOJ29_3864, partial [Thermoleophilaceae bacterium]|nr:hypothetical protein [Thermoleophilaceae bacterium]